MRSLPLVLALFVGSGCAALIYEVVWFQLLELTIGSSAVSIAVILATYMGGMFIGSLVFSRVVSVTRHPLKVYAVFELVIGACGLAVLWLLPYAGGLYAAIGGLGVGGLLFRGLLSAICLLPPTVLMGATLPAIARWVDSPPKGSSWLGFLYAGNTLGAVAGCLLASFYLLRVFDMTVATYVAVAINATVGGAALLLAKKVPYVAAGEDTTRSAEQRRPIDRLVLVTIGLSGLTALGAEVVWTRLLALQLDGTVYTYSLILAAVLLGIGLGSYAGSWVARSRFDVRIALGVSQVLIAVGIAWSAYWLMAVLPAQPDAVLSGSPVALFQHDFLHALFIIAPAALLWGASFPLALASAFRRGQDPGRSVGLVYAANTLGAVTGALVTPLVAMHLLGSQHILQLMIVIATGSGLLMLVSARAGSGEARAFAPRSVAMVTISLVIALILVFTVQPLPGPLVGYGRFAASWDPASGEFLYVGEGMNASIGVSRLVSGALNYHNAGKVQASSEPQDLRLERMLGHLTTLVPEDPESVLVIGCGAGVTAGAVSIDPRVEKVTMVEIEPLVPEAARTYFAEVNEGVVGNPKNTVITDDGRHYLMNSPDMYDAITCDPFDPWTKGAAPLSTVEFLASAKEHLNPGGVLTLWVPLYEMRPETAKSEIATFMSVFPDAIVWGNTANGVGYDIVLSGRVDDTPIDVGKLEARAALPEYVKVRESLSSIGFYSVDGLFATYAGQGRDLKTWVTGTPLNTDRDLRLQYLAGIGLYSESAESIYAEIVSRRTWPEHLFAGSPQRVEAMKKSILGE